VVNPGAYKQKLIPGSTPPRRPAKKGVKAESKIKAEPKVKAEPLSNVLGLPPARCLLRSTLQSHANGLES
jgi:hypothetical protein